MRFDDRLRTVLAQPASDPHDRAVRWRQLVELTARAGPDADPDLLEKAIDLVRIDSKAVDERVRSAAALAVARLQLPAELVAVFASDGIAVAAPVLASARLTATEWKHVSAASSEECRAFIASMHSERPGAPARPEPPAPEPPAEAPKPMAEEAPPATEPVPSISDVVARIEKLRHSREIDSREPPALPSRTEAPRLFRWECNEAGEIDWVEGVPRGPLVGRSIAHGGQEAGIDRSVGRAFAARAPFHDGVLELAVESAIGGTWKISGVPAFERSSGRFAGYRGVAERNGGSKIGRALASSPDSLRELAHEIKTPLNAIIGFGEIISGEYLGPANARYRERANDIVAQARLLLNAIDDLDFAARARSAGLREQPRIDLGELVESLTPALRELGEARNLALDVSIDRQDLAAAVDPELAQRLILRLCGALVDRADSGEHLRLAVGRANGHCTVSLSRPAALRGISDELLFGSGDEPVADAFRLRLARGLARGAGADLLTSPDAIILSFPRP
ncbi:MAG TPA: histidine kinase dimerization/phospho-acceptor domain-containing protein [Sphingomicrobium sp.]|nr:histidine kinase dimerization/phospho-acceptor domain-containing protein [Sphingomicrobium sp.]